MKQVICDICNQIFDGKTRSVILGEVLGVSFGIFATVGSNNTAPDVCYECLKREVKKLLIEK